MKTKYLLFVGLVVVLGSCSSAYRTGQTPDDVYFSPVPAEETYVVRGNSDERDSYNYPNSEEREIRRAIRDPRYRAVISGNVGYGYSPYMYNPYANGSFGYSPFGYSSFGYSPFGGYSSFGYNPYSFNNFGYNSYYDPFGYNYYNPYTPYYGSYYPGKNYYPGNNYYPVIGNTIKNTGPRKVNLGAYTPSPSTQRSMTSGNRPGVTGNTPSAPVRRFDSRTEAAPRERTGVGNVIRRVFTPSESREYTPSTRSSRNTPSNNESPARTFDPPTRSTNSPSRTFDPPTRSTTPPASNQSSTPVRTFRNN